ncbi:DUF3592 domain-containing protein [Kitasatospora sp. NPDC096128]|uniref:DUF3592 domain-containing protein n=1 Tax=Kitasatospora sp. NPDC096128 TaxID=3155547 RepID=UPI0033331A3C
MRRGIKDARLPRNRHWAAGIPLAVLGIGLIGAMVHLGRQEHDFESRALHAQATIIRIEQAQDHRSNGARYLLGFDPSTRLAAEWTSGGGVTGNVGTTVDVIYDPSEPTHLEATSDLTLRRRLPAVMFGGGGVTALVVAAVALYGAPRHKADLSALGPTVESGGGSG